MNQQRADLSYLLSAIMTAIAFFIVGAIKSRFVQQRWWWWWSGFKTLAVGAMAAAIAFLRGYALSEIHSGAM